MGVKIYYKGPIVWNMILYSFFSLVFIYFQNIYRAKTSILNEEFYQDFIWSNWPLVSLVGLTVLFFFLNFKKLATSFYLILIGVTLSTTTYYLFLDFTKIPLIFLFIYLLFGFYLFQFYSVETEESYYNPLFHKNDLFKPSSEFGKVRIYKNDRENAVEGILTNWSADGCFVYLEEPKPLKGSLNIEVEFNGLIFTEKANMIAVTSERSGYGFKFKISPEKNNKNNSLGWMKFYEIISELGYQPELLK